MEPGFCGWRDHREPSILGCDHVNRVEYLYRSDEYCRSSLWDSSLSGGTGLFSYADGSPSLTYSYTAVPEPQTWALATLGLGRALPPAP